MVKRSYSRVLYSLPVVTMLYGFVWTLRDTLDLAARGRLCLGSACDDITGSSTLIGIIVPIAFLFFAWSYSFKWRKAAHFDAQWQAAAAGNGPVLSVSAVFGLGKSIPLALPLTIRLRFAWRSRQTRIVFIVLFALLTSVALCTALTYMSTSLPAQWPVPLIFLASEVGFGLFLLFIFALLYFSGRERLTVTEDGLRMKRFGVTKVVRWNEVRLFARRDLMTFELASQRSILRLTYLKNEESLKPTIPFDEYRAQMSAVFALIAERTGVAAD